MDVLPTRRVRHPRRQGGPRPAQLIALTFGVAIAVGTILLLLPVSHAPGQAIGFLDALFTATSAVCVTGLIVVDTGGAFSRFGELVILLLIQIGGFGILSLGTIAALLLGRRVGFRQRMQLQAQFNALEVGGVVRLLRRIALLVLGLEALGALAMWPRFAGEEGTWEGLYYALFHSVSAFNNAGFSLYADSLMRFADGALVQGVVLILLLVGGFGYLATLDLARRFRRPHTRMLLHTRLALVTSAALLGVGTVVVAALEWSNPGTLGALSTPGKLAASLFQSATPRTTGFNTIDTAALAPATMTFVMLLMFVGGSPGSTAGGIKTVTFFVLVGSAWNLVRGRGELQLFGRRLATSTVVRAAVIAFLAANTVGLAFTLLLLTDGHLGYRPLLFEAISAFGTVGLTTGLTGELSGPGRAIVIVLMFVGRLGPLTAALALVDQPQEAAVHRPAEEVAVG